MKNKLGAIALVLWVAGLLAGCGGSDSAAGGATATGSLNGTAAVGHPLVGGTISVKCAAGGALAATTGSAGNWSVTLSGQTLPCALQVGGGTVNGAANTTFYHSIATVPGTVNVTPLTDLLVANLAGSATPVTWFAGLNSAALGAITQSQVDASLAQLRGALVALPPLSGINPITTAFTPTSGNNIDDMLTALNAALGGSGVSYATLLGNAAAATFVAPPGYSAALAAAFAATPSGAGAAAFDGTEAALAGDSQVTLSWAAVPGAGSYNIRRSVGGGAFAALASNVASPYLDNGLSNGTGYSYIVVARDAGNTADLALSATLNATPTASATPALAQNGLALGLDGHTYVFQNASVYRYSPGGTRVLNVNNPLVGVNTLADMTPFHGLYLNSAQLSVAMATGNQVCGSGAGEAALSFALYNSGSNAWNGPFTATSCTIRIDYMSTLGGMGGEIVAATLSNGSNTVSVSHAPFRVYQHNGIDGSAPALADNAWASFNVSGGTYELPANKYFVLPENTGNKVGSSFSFGVDPHDGTEPVLVNGVPSNIAWIVQNSFFASAASYSCGTTYSGIAPLNMQLWLGTYGAEYAYLSSGGGSCTITVDQLAGGLYKGHYSATLQATDALLTAAEKTLSINGEFRNFLTSAYRAGNGGNEGDLPADGITLGSTLLVASGSTHWVDAEQFMFSHSASSSLFANLFRADFVYPGNSKLKLRLFELPKATGDYTCGTLYSGQKMTMYLATDKGVTYDGGLAGTSCAVHISRYDTIIEGTYSATLGVGNGGGLATAVLPNNDATISVSGSFRAPAP